MCSSQHIQYILAPSKIQYFFFLKKTSKGKFIKNFKFLAYLELQKKEFFCMFLHFTKISKFISQQISNYFYTVKLLF